MIADAAESERVQHELRDLEERLAGGAKGFTKAGVRKKIARLHGELAAYEGSEEARQPDTK